MCGGYTPFLVYMNARGQRAFCYVLHVCVENVSRVYQVSCGRGATCEEHKTASFSKLRGTLWPVLVYINPI